MASLAARATALPVCSSSSSSSSTGRRTATSNVAATPPRPADAERCSRRRGGRLLPRACDGSHHPSSSRSPSSRTTTIARGLRSALAASLSPRRKNDDEDENDDQEQGDDSASGAAAPASIVVTGFSPDECAYCRAVLGLPLVAATPSMLGQPLERQAALAAAELDAALARDAEAEEAGAREAAEEADGGQQQTAAERSSSDASFFSSSSSAPLSPPNSAALALGRTALFVGDLSFAAEHAASLNDELASANLVAALVAASPPKHAALPLRDALLAIRQAHARTHRLVQPLRVDPALAALPEGATVAMNLELDAGNVPLSAVATAAAIASSSSSSSSSSTPPLTRRDASRVVVLDGLLSDEQRAELFAAVTSPGHDPALPPPSDKWEARLVDRAGEPPTWGLRASAVRSLLVDPPRALIALQSRLALLYPEYQICAMPAAAMRGAMDNDNDESDEDENDDDEGNNNGNQGAGMPYLGGEGPDGDGDGAENFTSPIVANAVAPGDPVAWHVDADPSLIPADAPFSLHYGGAFFNREPGMPLFVSVMAYLNQTWQDDWHAETLFLDPSTGVGAFSSAKPGRVVLMCQDMAHRIGAPSAVRAPGLRYSLVLKTVWIPKEDAFVGGGGATGIARPEWGPPQQLGSAAVAIGPRGREVVAPTQTTA